MRWFCPHLEVKMTIVELVTIHLLNLASTVFSLLNAPATDSNVCQRRSELQEAKKSKFQMDRGLYHLEKIVLASASYLLPLASKTSFTEWFAKPSRAPTLICLPCCAILACSKVGT
jgi:hypothetical protein